MATRRQGREWALQALVQFDLNPPVNLDEALQAFWQQQEDWERERLEADERLIRVFSATRKRDRQSLADTKLFAEARVHGVMSMRDELDEALTPFLENWSLYRLGTVERNVLRLGAWELLKSDVPRPIVVNEAVDLTKFFSETKSGRFVNGVLDKFAKAEHE